MSEDKFQNNDERIPRSKAAKVVKKCGKGVEWLLKLEFDKEFPFVGSDLDLKLKRDYIRHKMLITKAGEISIYWCRFGKKRGFSCPVKVKIVRKNEKVFFMEEIDPKVHDHTENREERIYENYMKDQVEAMKECIDLDMRTRYIKKSLKKKELLSDASIPKPSSFYHKVHLIKKQISKDQVKISVSEFHKILNENSYFPENAHEAFVVKSFVEENGDGLKYCVLISTQALMKRNLFHQDKDWCLLVDATYQTNMEGAPVILFGANTFQTGKKFVGIGALISSNEDKLTYDFLLQFIKDEAKTVPLAVMADGSKAISSSCSEKLPDSKRLMCWYHVCKNIREKLVGVKNLDVAVSNNIFSDINVLQYGAPDEESFNILFALLTRKWTEEKVYTTDILKDRVADFFLYMEKV